MGIRVCAVLYKVRVCGGGVQVYGSVGAGEGSVGYGGVGGWGVYKLECGTVCWVEGGGEGTGEGRADGGRGGGGTVPAAEGEGGAGKRQGAYVIQ